MKQRFYFHRAHWNAGHVALLLLLTLLCYWPLSFGAFSAKNDNIVQFLPVRFQISEALRSGHLPLWSPYMYLGYPVHGDMQGGAWNPLVWLLSLFGRYNLTSLHVEILVYIFTGALGMYRLLGAVALEARWRLAGAAAYLMCGYITDVGGSNLPFLAVVAYIPFAMAYGYRLLVTLSAEYVPKLALALALLFVSGYPSFFILTCYILAAGWLTVFIRDAVRGRKSSLKRQALLLGGAALLFLGLSAPAILSYTQILPYYQRGSGVGLAGALQNSFHPSCIISFILPSVPIKNESSFTTDLISRNAYFNSFFLLFILYYTFAKKRMLLGFALTGLIFFFLFSLGPLGAVRGWCYQFLPLMNTFRHPSNARFFVIMAGILIGANVGQQLFSGQLQTKYAAEACYVLAFFLLIGSLMVSIKPAMTFGKIVSLFRPGTLHRTLKDFLDGLNMGDMLLINGLLQLLFLLIMGSLLLRKQIKWVLPLFILNSFLLAQLCIPYTLVSKTPPAALNRLLNQYPKGYPAPRPDESIASASATALDHFDTLGITAFYQKKIAFTPVAFTPTFMTAIEEVEMDSSLMQLVMNNPYAYLAEKVSNRPFNAYEPAVKNDTLLQHANRTVVNNDTLLQRTSHNDILLQHPSDTISNETLLQHKSHLVVSDDPFLQHIHLGTGQLSLNRIWNNGFDFTADSKDTALLCLQQLYLPGWRCTVDGNKAALIKANGAFMAVLLAPGRRHVVFSYEPGGALLWLALGLCLICVVLLCRTKLYRGEKNLFKR